MVNIGQSFGGMPVYFIRWNPDNYCPFDERKICEDIKKRHKLVGDLIKHILNKRYVLPKSSLVSAIYLYFDEWDCLDKEEWKSITPLGV